MKTFHGLAERQNIASGLPQRLEPTAQKGGRHIEPRIPTMFVIQGHAVVTEDNQAVAAPIAIGYGGEIPGPLGRLIDR
jgi:hypothetical protein